MRNKILLFVLYILFPASLFSLPIDLTESPIYIKQGFSKEWINDLPMENDSSWIKKDANKGNRPIRIRELGYENLPKFKHFSVKKYQPETFTFVTSFEITEKELKYGSLGLYLAQIGQNWIIYLNGIEIKNQEFIEKDGSIKVERAIRGELIEIEYNVLKIGKNILAFKIIGDPTDDRTGFFMGQPYIIENYTKLKYDTREYIDLMLIAVYLFFGIYHIILFIFRKKERFNFYYGVGTLVLSTYLICRSQVIYTIIDDSLFIKNAELMSVFLILPFFTAFMDLMIRNRLTLFIKFYGAFCLILSLMVTIVFRESILRIWQATVLVPLLYIFIFDIIIPLFKDAKTRYKSHAVRFSPIKILTSLIVSIVRSIPGNVLIGFTVILLTSIFDIIMMNRGIPVNFTKYGFFVFVIGIAGILANRFINVHRALEDLNRDLEKKVEERTAELEKTNTKLKMTMDALWGEMELAKKIQTALLPEKPAIDGYEIVAHTVPADEVGGDYYDILSIEDKDWLVIGDVSGHGVPAGLIMMMVQTAIQTTLMKNPNLSPTELLLVVNKSISKNIRKLGEDKYMTITVFALLDNNKFYFSGLHQDLFIYRHASKDVEIRETDGTWIGLFEDIEGMNKDEHFIMESGDCLLLFTDGITESWHKGSTKENRKPEADMFGDKKLVELFKENGHKPCEEIKNSILSALEDYDSVDDITMVFLKKI